MLKNVILESQWKDQLSEINSIYEILETTLIYDLSRIKKECEIILQKKDCKQKQQLSFFVNKIGQLISIFNNESKITKNIELKNKSSYMSPEIFNSLKEINVLLLSYHEYMIKEDNSRVDIEESLYVFPKKIRTLFHIIKFSDYMQSLHVEYSLIFKGKIDNLIDNINELSIAFSSWKIVDKKDYFSEKYGLNLDFDKEDTLFTHFFHKILIKFEETVENSLWTNWKLNSGKLLQYRDSILWLIDSELIDKVMELPVSVQIMDTIKNYKLSIEHLLFNCFERNWNQDKFLNSSFIEYSEEALEKYWQEYYKFELTRKILEDIFEFWNSVKPDLKWKENKWKIIEMTDNPKLWCSSKLYLQWWLSEELFENEVLLNFLKSSWNNWYFSMIAFRTNEIDIFIEDFLKNKWLSDVQIIDFLCSKSIRKHLDEWYDSSLQVKKEKFKKLYELFSKGYNLVE